jgi:hypothetical protein
LNTKFQKDPRVIKGVLRGEKKVPRRRELEREKSFSICVFPSLFLHLYRTKLLKRRDIDGTYF